MNKTLLLVFIHGFKGTDNTFENFPADLRALLAHTLPKIEVLSVQYPRYDTRGDLRECVARFKEWLQNKVIDIEVANRAPSPTVDPSVRVVLCGHSMGGIVAAETLLSIARDEPLPSSSPSQHNATESEELPSASGPVDPTRLLFPYIQAIIAFDTPYLGISPGVLAHGAEEHLNQATSAYKAYDSASSFFGWKSPRSATPQPIADAANRGLPAPAGGGSGAWNKWGKYAALGGAAAALAGAAGAAYYNRNQISQGLTWAGSHLEFVGTLARGAELQRRVESVVQLTKSHGVGFADFYTALGEKGNSQAATTTTTTSRSQSRSRGADRTFCVVPKSAREHDGVSSGSGATNDGGAPAGLNDEMHDAEQVQQFMDDTSLSKGHWVRCVNEAVPDELKAHTSMFSPRRNPQYHSLLPMARDEIAKWIDMNWYDGALEEGRKDAGGDGAGGGAGWADTDEAEGWGADA